VEGILESGIKKLLACVEPLPIHPDCLPVSILWDYDDCENDPSGETIITEANKHQLKLSITIHHPDGQKISCQQYLNMQTSANIIMQNLIAFADVDPCSASHSSAWTRSFIKGVFPAKF
jgi:hypothetical protein